MNFPFLNRQETPRAETEAKELRNIAPANFFGPAQMQSIPGTVERATNVKVNSITNRA
ncbi:MAG: hypothetical protein WCT53_01680 [Candidatus Gracilibacteria bacterium]